MGRRPRLLLVAPLALVAVLLGRGAASSQPAAPATPVPVHGSVTAEGVLADLPGWSVVHDQPGIYRLVGPATGVVDDVPLWDAAADVTITPEGAGITEVRFTLDSEPVDTRFSFVGSDEG